MLVNLIFFRESIINKTNNEKLAIYETYIPIIDDIIDEFRAKQHDYHNHIQTMVAMSEKMSNKLSNALSEYVKEAIEEDVWRDLIKLQNKVVMALFYSKHNSAKQKGIMMIINITNFTLGSVYTNYEIVEIYGILIDNAIEATQKSEKKTVKIYLERKDGKNLFRILSPSRYISSFEITKFFNNGFSNKSEKNHGIGLYKFKKLVDLKNGTILFYYDTISQEIVVEIQHL